mmetsp:Transcript_2728/g.6602  ORF Transcript_2728/g.6602 Transcript_2728/m.6602 type:complete len:223 (-) Transcript_2728:11-679(-)
MQKQPRLSPSQCHTATVPSKTWSGSGAANVPTSRSSGLGLCFCLRLGFSPPVGVSALIVGSCSTSGARMRARLRRRRRCCRGERGRGRGRGRGGARYFCSQSPRLPSCCCCIASSTKRHVIFEGSSCASDGGSVARKRQILICWDESGGLMVVRMQDVGLWRNSRWRLPCLGYSKLRLRRRGLGSTFLLWQLLLVKADSLRMFYFPKLFRCHDRRLFCGSGY